MAILAARFEGPLPVQEIATASKVPPDYLSKVLQALNRAGLVNSHRGKHGGHCLARPAEDITILDVINAVDPIHRIHKCPLGLAAHRQRLCPLHRKLDDAARVIEEAFASTRLCDVLEEGPTSFPPAPEAVHAQVF